MTRAQFRDELVALPPSEWSAYLTFHSGLPGPRANLTLLDAAGDVMAYELALELARSDDEYLACCGVVALGRLSLEGHDVLGLITARCSDERWRVREGCAIAVQRIGDADPALARGIVQSWVASDDPLVVRAAIAAICEPRLLVSTEMRTCALAACSEATGHLLSTPADGRKAPSVRTLRQALAYCWSVAVAAAPEDGLPLFLALPVADPDVAWLVRENRTKKRLAAYL